MITIVYHGSGRREEAKYICSICEASKSVKYAIKINNEFAFHICNKCLAIKNMYDSIEVNLELGLESCIKCKDARLYSDGLNESEYIHYIPNLGLCYEDGALIGKDVYEALKVLEDMKWVKTHKFFLK